MSPADPFALAPEDIARRAAAAGVVGLGGATFPSAVKFALGKRLKVTSLIVNGGECEPYLSSDDRIMRDFADQVVDGARLVMHAIGASEALVGIEDNKPEAIAAMRLAAAAFPEVKICPVPSRYPMGSDKQLIQTLTGKEVPSDARAAEVGVLVHNVSTCAAVHKAVRLGRPLVERIVTLNGGAIAQPGNIYAPLGTLVSELLAFVGLKEPPARLLLGGPMMGTPLVHDRIPLVKGASGILAFDAREAAKPEAGPCIRCGTCADACPMGLLPMEMAARIRVHDLEGAETFALSDCISCGCCAYVCPLPHPPGAVLQPRQGRVVQQRTDQAAHRRHQAAGRGQDGPHRTRKPGKGRRRGPPQGRARSRQGSSGGPGRHPETRRRNRMSLDFAAPVAAPHTTTRNNTTRIMATVMLALAPRHPVRILALRLAGHLPLADHHRLRPARRSVLPAPARTGSRTGPARRLGGADRLAAGRLSAPLGALVDRRIRRTVRHHPGQAGLRRPGAEPVQPGHGGPGGPAHLLPGADDLLGGRRPPCLSAAAPGPIEGLMIFLKGITPAFDALTSATTLGFGKTEMSRGVDLLHSAAHAPALSLSGYRPGSLGETAAWLVAAGGIAMIYRRIISWHIPLAMLLGLGLPAALCHAIDPARYLDMGSHLLSGGAMLGAFFIATDYVTSPTSPVGKLVFGAGCGLLTFIIRTWAGYPEGVAFAVMLMNALTPIIDTYCKPRIYGRDRRGQPLKI